MQEKQRRIPVQARALMRYHAVLDASTRVLLAQGYSRFTMSELCLESGQAYATVYQYFSGKDDVLLRWMDRLMDELLSALSIRVKRESTQSPGYFVDLLIRETLLHIEANSAVLRCLFEGMPQLLTSDLVAKMETKTLGWIRDEFFSGFPSGRQKSVTGVSPLDITVRLIIGFCLQQILSHQRERDVIVESQALSTMVKGYLFARVV